ncbi:MAG: GTP-binding protein [Bacteroidales bacterium]|nr:GTP-binding protein [Bacteroidales bacterium]HNW72050.1 GTP-binding protein [Bacteroidales bacterium]HPS49090.1 GTP-binding protein [Bacteroidales bacterium]
MEASFSSKAYLDMELLRFTTAGSVDDGKSTLIGRLLYDSKSIFEDQLDAVKRASLQKGGDFLNLALFTDGLRAEREQGITIDVAYRYFATPKRKFIIADTPGHIQYTRNMVTGASTANAAIVLIDARNGVIEQTHRHAFIASLLGIPHIIVCINKMDLVGYRQDVFDQIRLDFKTFSDRVFPLHDIRFIPISALNGDNVVKPSIRMPWYDAGTLLNTLETIPINQDHNFVNQRFPVQYVIRPESDEHHDYRGYAGCIAGGIFHPGDPVVVLPSGIKSKIVSIDTLNNTLTEAFPPMSVTLTLEDDLDISRGGMITGASDLPTESSEVELMICWMNPKPLQMKGRYTVKHTTNEVRCKVEEIIYLLNISTLDTITPVDEIRMNDIARIRIRTTKPLYYDPYSLNRITGSLILIDEATNETLAAGMIV